MQSSRVSGSNVYGILRAGRAHSAEALILSAPLHTQGRTNHNGIAIILSLAKYFKCKQSHLPPMRLTVCYLPLPPARNYWAKDIVFLVTTSGELGAQAWIDAYVGTHTPSKYN